MSLPVITLVGFIVLAIMIYLTFMISHRPLRAWRFVRFVNCAHYRFACGSPFISEVVLRVCHFGSFVAGGNEHRLTLRAFHQIGKQSSKLVLYNKS